MLTKKDYKAIGLIFRKHLEALPDEILSDFEDFFQDDNPNFSSQKFREFIFREGA
jgi:hypothetical protein